MSNEVPTPESLKRHFGAYNLHARHECDVGDKELNWSFETLTFHILPHPLPTARTRNKVADQYKQEINLQKFILAANCCLASFSIEIFSADYQI
jgi:hypothetical protein